MWSHVLVILRSVARLGSFGVWGCLSGFVKSQVDVVTEVMAGLHHLESWRFSMKAVQLHGLGGSASLV